MWAGGSILPNSTIEFKRLYGVCEGLRCICTFLMRQGKQDTTFGNLIIFIDVSIQIDFEVYGKPNCGSVPLTGVSP